MKKYTALFQVRTTGGRLIASCCSIEHAEYHERRGRTCWKWIDGEYRCIREW